MNEIVLFGVSSPLIVDAEEACSRAGVRIVAGVRNVDEPSRLLSSTPVIDVAALSPEMLATPFLSLMFTPAHRLHASDQARRLGFREAATLIDPTASMARSATIGPGSFMNTAAVVAGACTIGRMVVINRSASVGHHCLLEDFVSIGPGVVIAGNVSIGRGTVVSAGAVVLPEVSIGSNCVIGAGSVVDKSIPPNCLADGHPCRVRRSPIAGFKGVGV